jgi:uncharacterized membrane protein
MAKKYDTNPLDNDFLRRAEEASFGSQTQEFPANQTNSMEAETRQFVAPAPTAEMQTKHLPRQFEEPNINEPYNSVFNRPQGFYAQTNAADMSVSVAAQKLVLPPTSRAILGLGLPEKIAMILPYLPFSMGAIAAVIELLFVARSETRVRFHAAQGLALHLVWWIIGAILMAFGGILPFASLNGKILTAIITIYFVVSLIRVWKGKPNHIEMLDDVTDFLNDKIKPKSK